MVVLAGVAIAVNIAASSGHGRDTATAVVRAVVQLAALAAVLAVVIHSLWASALFTVIMAAVAAATAAGRIAEGRRSARMWLYCLLPVAVPTAVIISAVVLLGVVPAKGIAIIPTAGIMLGNAMIATSLAGRHSHDELSSRHGEVDATLSLGFMPRDARMEIVRPAAATALIPGIDQTRSVGLVTIPGAFVGMVLGGASTTAAAIMQLFVLVALLAVSAIAVLTTTELVSRGQL
ncbi:ABC transporter permease [Gordonia araii NBRC 100433]|nr:ABC transporter permease [Gordonia araii]NNG98298.1 ABC transporter permease [Gordonia araii NBRC 100433]